MSKELTTTTPGAYLTTTASEALAILQENLEPGEALGPKDMVHITVPAGGGIAWELPGADGKLDTVRELNAVIVHHAPNRAYWANDLGDGGGGTPPDCVSNDGINGEALTSEGPGGDCESCPFNQWKSDPRGGKGKACKQTYSLILRLAGSPFPAMLRVPPTSLESYKRYRTGTLVMATPDNPRRVWDVETIISLEKVPNANNITYGRIVFQRGRDLSPEEKDAIAVERAKIVEAVSN